MSPVRISGEARSQAALQSSLWRSSRKPRNRSNSAWRMDHSCWHQICYVIITKNISIWGRWLPDILYLLIYAYIKTMCTAGRRTWKGWNHAALIRGLVGMFWPRQVAVPPVFLWRCSIVTCPGTISLDPALWIASLKGKVYSSFLLKFLRRSLSIWEHLSHFSYFIGSGDWLATSHWALIEFLSFFFPSDGWCSSKMDFGGLFEQLKT